jgi:hypothetical protein
VSFVLDNSVALTWCFEDERTPATTALLERVGEAGAVAPGLWPLEALNGLLVAERLESRRLLALRVNLSPDIGGVITPGGFGGRSTDPAVLRQKGTFGCPFCLAAKPSGAFFGQPVTAPDRFFRGKRQG